MENKTIQHCVAHNLNNLDNNNLRHESEDITKGKALLIPVNYQIPYLYSLLEIEKYGSFMIATGNFKLFIKEYQSA